MGSLLKIMAIGIALIFVAAACGSDSDSSDNAASESGATTAAPNATNVSRIDGNCPERLVIQTDWFPEPEHAYLYQLIGSDGVVDANNGTYSGLIDGTNITLEIRAGGPYIGSLSDTEVFYADNDIYMAYVNTSSAIESYKTTPVVTIFTSFEVGPQILMWNPERWDFETFEDIGNSGATIVHFGGANYIKYLVAQGLVDAGNTDGSYDGSPGRFISEGDIVQQGFATAEPYKYQNEHENWLKPVDFLLIHDSGHEIYQSAISVKPETIETDAECLEFIVPMFQTGLRDYMANPEPINIKLDEIVKELDSFWTSSVSGHNFSSDQMRELGLITDGDNNYVGDMDEARIQRLIDELTPIYRGENIDGFDEDDPRLQASAIFTNRFLDTSIGLGF